MKSTVWNALFVLVCSSQIAAQGTASSPADVHLLDAVQAALARHPALEIQRQEVEIGKAVKQQASGAFDQLLESGFDRQRLYSPLAELTRFSLAPSNAAQLDASYSKLMRSGIAVSGSIGVSRQIKTPSVPGGLTTSSTRLQLLFPLMRGRGTGVTTASERAAGLQASSSVLALRQATATVMARVVSSYWGIVAAGQRRAVAIAAEERGARLLENTRALIAADQSPRSDLASALANAADREAARFTTEQTYVGARQQLWLDMGYRAEDRPEIAAVDDFSLFGEMPNVRDLPTQAEPFIAGALDRRADYLAAEDRVASAR